MALVRIPLTFSARRKIECSAELGAGDLSHAATLKGAFKSDDDRLLSSDLPPHHDAAVVGLRSDTLQRKPRGLHAIKGAEQLASCASIEERKSTRACIQLDEALTVEEVKSSLIVRSSPPPARAEA